MKTKNRLKNILKRIAITFIPVTAMIGSAFSFSMAPNKTPVSSSAPALHSSAQQAPAALPTVKFQESPENMYITYPFYKSGGANNILSDVKKPNQGDLGKMNNFFENLKNEVHNVIKTGNASNILDPISDAIQEAAAFVGFSQLGITTGVNKGVDLLSFYNRDEMFDTFVQLNDMQTNVPKSNVLKIKIPLSIKDAISTTPNVAPATAKKIIPANIVFKVSEIDVTSIGANDIVFDLEIITGTNTTGEKYHLVISKDAEQFLRSDRDNAGKIANADYHTLQQLLDLKYIYIRKASPTPAKTATTTLKQLSQKILLQRTASGNIEIFVKPGSDTVNFGINNLYSKKASAAIKFGFIDVNISPKHVTEGAVDPKLLMFDKKDATKEPIDIFDIFYLSTEFSRENNFVGFKKGTWTVPSTAAKLEMYLAPNEKLSFKIKYNKVSGSNTFKNGTDTLNIETDSAGALIISPSGFQVIQSSWKSPVQPIAIKSEPITVTSGNRTRLLNRVQIAFDVSFVSINLSNSSPQWEKPFILKKVNSGVFFEKITGNSTTQNNSLLPVTQFVDNAASAQTIIGEVYSNWAGLQDDPRGTGVANPYFILPIGAGPKGKDIFGTFLFRFQAYIEDMKNKSLKQGPNRTENITGVAIVNLLNTMSNNYAKWHINNLGLSASTVQKQDLFKDFDPSSAGGYAFQNILNGTGKKFVELKEFAEAAFKFYEGSLSTLSSAQSKILTDAKKSTSIFVKNKIFLINKKTVATNALKENARQMLYRFIEIKLAEALEEKAKVMFEEFKSKTNISLTTDFKDWLDGKSTDGSKPLKTINNEAIKNLNTSILGKQMDILVIDGNFVKVVQTGREQLESIINFINKYNVEEKFLNKNDAVKFKQLAKDITNPKTFAISSVTTAPQKVSDIMRILDIALNNIIAQKTSLQKIVIEKLSLKAHPKNWFRDKIAEVINKAAEAFSSNNSNVKYKYFSKEISSNFITNMLVGHNLRITAIRYLSEHKATLEPSEIAILKSFINGDAYNEDAIVRISINTGYYNVKYFLNGLADEKTAPIIIKDLLQGNLSKNISIELPDTNKIIDFMSNPSKIASLGMYISGGIITLLGIIISAISFKQKSKGSKKTIVMIRSLFIGLTILGIILILGPVMLSIAGGSGALSVFAA